MPIRLYYLIKLLKSEKAMLSMVRAYTKINAFMPITKEVRTVKTVHIGHMQIFMNVMPSYW